MSQVPQKPIFKKTDWHRDKDYRRHVASLPCKACGKIGRSQAAHIGTAGRGIKQHDYLVIPLCAPEPGSEGCHAVFDRNQKEFSRKRLKLSHRQLQKNAKKAWRKWNNENT